MRLPYLFLIMTCCALLAAIPARAENPDISLGLKDSAAATPDTSPRPDISSRDIRTIQDGLRKRGFYKGPVNGKWDPLTLASLLFFQRAAGIHPDGQPTPETLKELGIKQAGHPETTTAHVIWDTPLGSAKLHAMAP